MTRGHQQALASDSPARDSDHSARGGGGSARDGDDSARDGDHSARGVARGHGRGSARGGVAIGQVLDELSPEFPDISPSKIRFLEAEGLITPLRSASGYRRFTAADISRLRFILTAQRDEYLPLRVIKERLEADGGTGGMPGAVPAVAMTRSELLAAAGAGEELLAELEDYGLIRRGRSYGAPALSVLRAAVRLGGYGIGPRHLRVVKATADREADLVEQAVAPLARQKAGRETARAAAGDIAAQIAQLHAILVADQMAEAGLASAPAEPGRSPGESGQAPGLRSASGR